MGATNQTPKLNLPLFATGDKPSWFTDFNSAMTLIDTSYGEAYENAYDATEQVADLSIDVQQNQVDIKKNQDDITCIKASLFNDNNDITTLQETLIPFNFGQVTANPNITNAFFDIAGWAFAFTIHAMGTIPASYNQVTIGNYCLVPLFTSPTMNTNMGLAQNTPTIIGTCRVGDGAFRVISNWDGAITSVYIGWLATGETGPDGGSSFAFNIPVFCHNEITVTDKSSCENS